MHRSRDAPPIGLVLRALLWCALRDCRVVPAGGASPVKVCWGGEVDRHPRGPLRAAGIRPGCDVLGGGGRDDALLALTVRRREG
jgi:hypothetical protein